MRGAGFAQQTVLLVAPSGYVDVVGARASGVRFVHGPFPSAVNLALP
jgi:hypothetical protein